MLTNLKVSRWEEESIELFCLQKKIVFIGWIGRYGLKEAPRSWYDVNPQGFP